MKVKDLISLLKTFDPNEVVKLASDADGNAFRGVADVNSIRLSDDNEYYFDEDDDDEDGSEDELDFSDDAVDTKTVVCIWPN